jgi:hypothetical protein
MINDIRNEIRKIENDIRKLLKTVANSDKQEQEILLEITDLQIKSLELQDALEEELHNTMDTRDY